MPLARRLMDVPIPRVTFDALTSTLAKPTSPPAAVYIERHGHEQDHEDVWRLPTLNDITFVWGNEQYLDWWGWEALEDRLHVEKHRIKGKGAKYVRDISNAILESTFGDGDLQPKRTTYYRFNDPRQLGIEMEMKGVPVCETTNGKLKAKPVCAKGLECVEGLDITSVLPGPKDSGNPWKEHSGTIDFTEFLVVTRSPRGCHVVGQG